MIFGSCHFLFHQFTQRDEPDQIIADMDALSAFSAAFIRRPDALLKLMETKEYEAIKVGEICEEAGVGRTTFYRHLDNKDGKAELLVFKITYEWERYQERHAEEIAQDKNLGVSSYIYENRRLFTSLYEKGLITVIMRAFEILVAGGEVPDRNLAYLMSFFTYGYFGIIYQWIKYGFDETPEEIKKRIDGAIRSAASSGKSE